MVSDGTLTPEALAERAASHGVELWALTDHDEIGGQARAAAAAKAVVIFRLYTTHQNPHSKVRRTLPVHGRAAVRMLERQCVGV